MAICKKCSADTELCFGFCFDCASDGELRAARRTVVEHIAAAIFNARNRQWKYVRYDLRWATQRLFRRGDYARDGYFDQMGVDWRSKGTE